MDRPSSPPSSPCPAQAPAGPPARQLGPRRPVHATGPLAQTLPPTGQSGSHCAPPNPREQLLPRCHRLMEVERPRLACLGVHTRHRGMRAVCPLSARTPSITVCAPYSPSPRHYKDASRRSVSPISRLPPPFPPSSCSPYYLCSAPRRPHRAPRLHLATVVQSSPLPGCKHRHISPPRKGTPRHAKASQRRGVTTVGGTPRRRHGYLGRPRR
jgi:hypothetical protein